MWSLESAGSWVLLTPILNLLLTYSGDLGGLRGTAITGATGALNLQAGGEKGWSGLWRTRVRAGGEGRAPKKNSTQFGSHKPKRLGLGRLELPEMAQERLGTESF